MTGTAVPAAAFKPRPFDAAVPVGGSKLAGLPDLPQGMKWPMRPAYPDADSRYDFSGDARRASAPAHLPLVVQVNLADAWAAQPDLPPELPRTGLLSLFHDVEQNLSGDRPGDGVGSQVIWSDGGDLKRCAMPQALEEIIAADRAAKDKARRARALDRARAKQGLFDRLTRKTPEVNVTQLPKIEPYLPKERGLDPFAILTLPDLDETLPALRSVTPDYDRDDPETPFSKFWEDYVDYEMDNRFTQLCGQPNSLQGPEMPMEAQFITNGARWGVPEDAALREKLMPGVKDWILLMQVGSRDDVWMWGDVGFLYVWIRRQDLAARAFDKAWVFSQSH